MRTRDDELVRTARRDAVRRPEIGRGDGTLAADAAQHDLRVRGEQHGQRVSSGRRVDDVAADRAAVLDLRRADGRRALGQGRQIVAMTASELRISVYVASAPIVR